MKAIVTGTGVGVLFVLLGVGLGGDSLLTAAIALGAALGFSLLLTLGPDRLGFLVIIAATALAPMNAFRISDSGNVTYTDLLYLAGFALLVPRILTSTKKLPKLYIIGVTILLLNALLVSLLAPAPLLSLLGFARVAWAIIIIPIALARLDIKRNLLVVLAWAYVAGQTASAVYGTAFGITADNGRGGGYTTHVNFYGLAGQIGLALCIFLYYETPRRYRWVVIGAALVMLFSVIDSGSRASLLCVAVLVLLWPLVERSVMSVYLLLVGAAVAVTAANAVLANAPEGSAFARLQGEGSASSSSLAREIALQEGFDRFWQSPIGGSGFNDILDIHNVYLEVAVGGGVIALFGFLFVIASLVQPLFRAGAAGGAPNRLAYMGASYAVFALIGPTLYDRLLWAGLALVIACHDLGKDEPPGDEEPEPVAAAAKDLTRMKLRKDPG